MNIIDIDRVRRVKTRRDTVARGRIPLTKERVDHDYEDRMAAIRESLHRINDLMLELNKLESGADKETSS